MNLLKMSGSTLNSCDRAAEYVVIPPHIKTLKPGAFHGCTALRKVVFSYGIRDLPDGLFHNCIALREVVLPSGLQTIGKSCFRDCRQLRSVRIPSSCHNIGAFAFFGCERLESVTLPFESVAIEEAVFEGCSDLHTVVNLSHIVKIGKNAFYGCESLSNEFVVSSFLNEIGEKSFCRARVDHLVVIYSPVNIVLEQPYQCSGSIIVGLGCAHGILRPVICGIAESLPGHLVILSGVGDDVVGRNAPGIESGLGVKRHPDPLRCSPLGRHHYDSVGSAGSVHRVSGSVLQYCKRFYVIGRQRVETTLIRHAVNHDERALGC